MNLRWREFNLMLASLMLITVSVSTSAQTQSPTQAPIVVQVQVPDRGVIDYVLIAVQILTLLINAAALWGLFLYVRKTIDIADATKSSVGIAQDTLSEMRTSRIQDIAPNVIAYVDMPYEKNFVMFFVVKNIGKSVAKDISLKFEPKLKTDMTPTGSGSADFDIPLLNEGIKSLAPGQEIRTSFSTAHGYFEENLPTSYTVEVSYVGTFQSERITTHQVIDLRMFEGLTVLQEKGEEDQIKAIEEIARSVKEMGRYVRDISHAALKGIWIKNLEYAPIMVGGDRRKWNVIAANRLTEFTLLWKSIYAGDYERRGSHYIDNLQSRISILSLQILSIASSAPADISSEIVNELTNVAERLSRLSEARFYMDGGESYRAFNSSGDEVLRLIEAVVERIRVDIQEELHNTNRNIEDTLLPDGEKSIEPNS